MAGSEPDEVEGGEEASEEALPEPQPSEAQAPQEVPSPEPAEVPPAPAAEGDQVAAHAGSDERDEQPSA